MLHAIAVALLNLLGRRATTAARRTNPWIARRLAEPRTIVVTRLQCLGDMIVFLPTLAALRRAYPRAHVTLLTKHATGDQLVRGCPLVDEVINLGQAGWRDKWRVFGALRRRRVDLFLISSQELGRVPWALASAARVIVGFRAAPGRSKMVHEKLPGLLSLPLTYDLESTEAENNLQLVAALTGRDTPLERVPISWCPPQQRASAERMLLEVGIDPCRPIVVLSTGAKAASKLWPLERFAELAQRLEAEHGAQIVFTGGPNEQATLQALIDRHDASWKNLAGRWNVQQFAAALGHCSLLITVESGPVHIGDAMNLPMVVLSGPTDLRRWRPTVGDPARQIIINKNSPCAPCAHVSCPLPRHACMLDISIDEVVAAAAQLFAKQIAPKNAAA
jgi:ADP-heptose:LPS heptosyltransferase